MAISFVGQNSANATSVTLPGGINVGDVIIIFAYRSTTTAPTLPAGYTSIASQSANGNSFRVGYKFAVGGDTSGTWTNATFVMAVVYRGVAAIGSAGSTTNASASTTTITGIATFRNPAGNSWVVSWAGSLQTTSMSTPAGTSLEATQTAAASMGIMLDSGGGTNSYGQKLSTNGTNAAGAGGSVELIPTGQISFVQSASGSSSLAGATSAAITTAPSDLVVLMVESGINTGTISVSDSKSNTWTQIGSQFDGTTYSAAMFYCSLTATGTGHTFSCADTGTANMAIVAQEFTAVTTLDQSTSANGIGGTITSGNAATTTAANELVVGAAGTVSVSTISVGSGFSNFLTQADGGTTNKSSMESKVVTNTGAYAGLFGGAANNGWVAFVATFKGAAVAGEGAIIVPTLFPILNTQLSPTAFGVLYSSTNSPAPPVILSNLGSTLLLMGVG